MIDRERIEKALEQLKERKTENMIEIAENKVAAHYGMEIHEKLCSVEFMLKQQLAKLA